MATDVKIREGKLQCDINREEAKYFHCHQVKLININMLHVEKNYLLIKVE